MGLGRRRGRRNAKDAPAVLEPPAVVPQPPVAPALAAAVRRSALPRGEDMREAAREALRQLQAEDAARLAAEEEARWAMPSPCVFCGYSGLNGGQRDRATGEVTPWVWGTDRGPACSECWTDTHPYGGGSQIDDDDHRERVLRRLLGPAADGWTPGHLMDRTGGGFVWWWELPGAPASDTTRFGYITGEHVADMAARLEPPRPDFRLGPPCVTCGQSDRWIVEPGTSGSLDRTVYQMPARLVCSPCRLVDRDAPEIPLGDGVQPPPAPHPMDVDLLGWTTPGSTS